MEVISNHKKYIDSNRSISDNLAVSLLELICDDKECKNIQSTLISLHNDRAFPHIGKAAITIGAFDGVHLGHRALIDQAIQYAKNHNIVSCIVTFDIDPDEYFKNDHEIKKLMLNKDRLSYLQKLGADYVISVPFTHELSKLTYEEFLEDLLGSIMDICAIHVGCDFKLGAGGKGDIEALKKWAEDKSIELFDYELVCAHGEKISSTRIRSLLEKGAIKEVEEILGRWYFLRGTVIKGRGVGKDFGIPTANVKVTYPYVLPRQGVYSGFVVVDGYAFPTALAVGAPITFTDTYTAQIEAHLIGFDSDIYGREVQVVLCKHLRDMQKFKTQEALIETIYNNIQQAKDELGSSKIEVKSWE